MALTLAGCDLREGAPGRAHRLGGADRRCRRQRPGPARGARHGDRRVRGRDLLDRVPALPRPARAQGRATGDLRRPQGPESRRKPHPRRHPAKMPRVPVEEPGFGTRPVSDHATAAATSTFWTARTSRACSKPWAAIRAVQMADRMAKRGGCEPLEIDRRGRQIGLDLHVVEATPGQRVRARAKSWPPRESPPTDSDDAGPVAILPWSSARFGDGRGAMPDSHARSPPPC